MNGTFNSPCYDNLFVDFFNYASIAHARYELGDFSYLNLFKEEAIARDGRGHLFMVRDRPKGD